MKKQESAVAAALDYEKIDKIFEESQAPMRSIVEELKKDNNKRSLFLDHLKKLKRTRREEKLESQGGRNFVTENEDLQ